MEEICFFCGEEIDFALAHSGFSTDKKLIGIAFHPVCRGKFAKVLIDGFIKDEMFREKVRKEVVHMG